MRNFLQQLQLISQKEVCEIPLEFNLQNDDRRQYPRVCVPPEFYIIDSEKSRVFDAVDLSSGGICLVHKGWRFAPGDLIVFDLIYRDHYIIQNANALIARVDSKCMGCQFINISHTVGEKITRFVLKKANTCWK